VITGEGTFPPLIPILRDRAGAVVGYTRQGVGQVVLVAGGDALSNAGIGEGDNIVFAVNALSGPRGGRPRIYFDEYHQGFPEVTLWRLINWRGKVGLALLALAAVVLLFARSRRFGAPLPAPDLTPRQRSEYLGSMTAVLQRGRATRLALRTSYQRALDRLCDRYGLERDAAPAQVAAAAAARGGPLAGELGALVEQCEAALAAPALEEAAALRLVARLDRAVNAAEESR
jgi:hypothetical protein